MAFQSRKDRKEGKSDGGDKTLRIGSQEKRESLGRERGREGEIEAAAGDEWRGGRQKIIVGIRLLAVGGREKREIRGV